MLRSGRALVSARSQLQLQQQQRFLAVAGKEKLFDKILIANRGEIACRVMRTAKKLGIKTVAIYSEPDIASLHVKTADEAYCVGPAASAKSYLNIPKILEIVKQTGAQAVHPGYGFLSENMNFAKALEDVGVAFIGPGSKAVKAMGDKIESKELAIKSKVSTVPGVMRVIKDADDCIGVARQVGYPVMIKASAGGGGKGMRIAWNDDEVRTGFRLSTEESKSSFGDDRIFVEKFVVQPRHVEIQILGDSHGNVVALPERECSIQRRNQKVLEEAPSSFIDPKTRAAMQAQAVALAKAVEYKSAGTVEFLVDKDKNFYFLEMNTRLQVEHPITELVTGVDIVEQMIRVAAGHSLPKEWLTGKGLPFKGWAHEARVYAEDPYRGFLPSIGRLVTYIEPNPEECEGVRCDSGIVQGSEISKYYDPMISKLCAYGPDRLTALKNLEVALDNYVIKGVGHNIPFLRDVIRAKRFQDGHITTNYIPEEYPEGFKGVTLTAKEKEQLAAVGALVHWARSERTSRISGKLEETEEEYSLVSVIDGKAYTVSEMTTGQEDEADAGPVLQVLPEGGEPVIIKVPSMEWEIDTPRITVTLNDAEIPIQYTERLSMGYRLTMCGAQTDVHVRSVREHELHKHILPKKRVDTSKWLKSPMPGTLVALHVKEGDVVSAGQACADVEAMKMVNAVVAPGKKTVKKILVKTGASLAVDEDIIEFA